jgi:hypothetical protein
VLLYYKKIILPAIYSGREMERADEENRPQIPGTDC